MSLSSYQNIIIATQALLVCLLLWDSALANDYESQLLAGKEKCERIPAFEAHTGLLFNPDGYRSYYGRSACYQRLAIQFRDKKLCNNVYRRLSLFSSSWGYSESNCRDLVHDAIESDKSAIQSIKNAYLLGPVKVVDFVLQRNGNGRDFDLIPRFSNGSKMGYELRFDILRNDKQWVKIFSQGISLGSENQRFNFYIKKDDIFEQIPDFDIEKPYSMRLDLTVSLPVGRANGRWPESWTQQIWPIKERSQLFTTRQKVAKWVPEVLE